MNSATPPLQFLSLWAINDPLDERRLCGQLENELGSAGSKGDDIARGSTDAAENARHVLHYYKIICDHGVDVPVIDISKWPGKEEAIASLVDTGGSYPAACFGCDGEVYPIKRERWGKRERPYVSIETGSSMFVRFYDLPPYRNTSRRAAQWKRDVRIETSARGIPCETSREYPARTQLNLPPNQNRILPFYLRIQPRTFLEYSTAVEEFRRRA